MRDFRGGALFDGNLIAACEAQIEGRNGSGDIKRNAVFFGQHGDRIGADFVGDIAIGSDAVGAHHDATNSAGMQEVAGHVVGDQSGGDVIVLQFPDGEARALQEWTRFVGEDVDLLAGSDGGANYAERRSVAGSGEGARVAMREDGFAIRDERRAVSADAFVDGDVIEADLLRFGDELRADFFQGLRLKVRVEAAHAFDGPEKIDRGGTRTGQGVADFIELGRSFCLLHSERDSHGGCDSDCGRAANDHGADGFGHLLVIGAGDIVFFARETSLIDHHDAGTGPLNGLDHMVLFCTRNAANWVRL